MSRTAQEIASQPECWRRVLDELPKHAPALPAPGERVAVIGCGTSWFMAQSYAALREAAGAGHTEAFPASQPLPSSRTFDRVVALTRSGTTTEVIDALEKVQGNARTTVITAVTGSPAARFADDVVELTYADEQSVVQTRFPTTQLVLLRAHLGEDLSAAVADAEFAVRDELDPMLCSAGQITFLGEGWAGGVALEAALKVREAAAWWTEAYPPMEYRHGPIGVAAAGRAVWSFGPLPEGLDRQILRTGAHLVVGTLDPLAELIKAQRVAVELARSVDRDVDNPPNLTRSVILESAE
ncbi:SIS domain-containing protein [Streptantibioticus cattleyicolor]|uniref:Putave phosphosugar isomerase n=1 Tax=Streptantibioticus cattleyicolor (strain ATCC 35852 / DSM 46488 / JCM 4925 / NBRC 14057 / NRRL 8057) TaxID=1003195 RepID=F8JLT2_STREN|nr:SIS domain-containing protein [Streptantibioticus cattleyicolor]AEW99484.1 putave phosphosugar isomerase [Streptantibioticus cattleyicolor NRRL 8057 = DSM 46488]CCB71475.1 Putave phosphosugar isomerase [Streptantibioticus cattleyicolor NRRL 8057 = DSM 46488]